MTCVSNPSEAKRLEDIQATKAKEVELKRHEIEQSKRVTVEDLTYAIIKYKKLGLDFIKGEENSRSIQINFTQIDPKNPNKAFSFLLCVTEGDRYEVEGCCPDLNAEVILSMVDDLNRNDDFAACIKNMRRAFKESLVE